MRVVPASAAAGNSFVINQRSPGRDPASATGAHWAAVCSFVVKGARCAARRHHARTQKASTARTYLGGRVGAHLVFSDHALIPGEFELMIPHKGDSRRVRIAWRLQDDVGIQFLEQVPDGRSAEPPNR